MTTLSGMTTSREMIRSTSFNTYYLFTHTIVALPGYIHIRRTLLDLFEKCAK
jgi:hypothetical protein